MTGTLTPLRAPSLKEVFVDRFERLILSGELAIGQRLPSERELAAQLGVSRPVVHEGLAELAARGLVTLRPRVGCTVNDYRTEGSLALLTSLINYRDGQLDPSLLRGMLDLRRLLEVETARLAALHRNDGDLAELERIVTREEAAAAGADEDVVSLDFAFHHRVALACGNPIYPLFLRSCEPAYTTLTGRFFELPRVRTVVAGYHRELLDLFTARDAEGAAGTMERMLEHGEAVLRDILDEDADEPAVAAGEGRANR